MPYPRQAWHDWVMIGWICCVVWSAAAKEDSKPKTPPHHHVVDIEIPRTMELKPPLAREDELKCCVCHGIEEIDKKPFEEADKKNPDFLRGGPYADLTQFCFLCHDKDSHKRPNIHALFDMQGNLREENCTYCHKEKLKTDTPQSFFEISLRAPVETICFGCHLKTPHWNALPHQVVPSDKVRMQMEKYLSEHPDILLPLSLDGKVICITCHTPHPKGVLAEHLPAAKQVEGDVENAPIYRESSWGEVVARDKEARIHELSEKYPEIKGFKFVYKQIAQEALLRLSAKNGELCRACHVFDE